MTYYKVLSKDGSAFHGGSGEWPLPSSKRPGRWLEVKAPITPCRHGLHVCTREQLIHWLGPAIFEVEVDEKHLVDNGDKTVVHRARLVRRLDTWNERTARLFAADCADKAIRDWQRASGRKCDPRSHAAIRAAREFANGNMSAAERSAAESAARSAAESAWSAAESAARSAAESAWSAARSAAESAWSAAESAARSAAESAWSAAESAARSAAWSAAESAWSVERSAWSAAESAARSAARSAAESAARSAARSAADSARSAARSWQARRLFEYLEGIRG